MKHKIKRKLRNISMNQVIMFAGVFLIFFITVGYSALSQILKVVGYASIDKGDGILFTEIVTKENDGATIIREGNIKAKTLVDTQVTFSKPGSVTYTVTAKNQGEWDAKLLEIKDIELTNNKDPQCINVSVLNHEINDKIFVGATKQFDIKITSTCSTLETKEISLKFNYVKTDTVNGEEPIPSISNKTKILLNNSDSTYRYMDGTYLGGAQSSNYVWFDGFLWRIMGENADGSIRMISEEAITSIPWGASNSGEQYDSSYVNDWLNNYFYPKLKDKDLLVSTRWCSETTSDDSSARTNCTNNLSETPKPVGLISLDEYNLSGASSSYLFNSARFWTLTPNDSESIMWVFENGKITDILRAPQNSHGVRPVINISKDMIVTEGNGTLNEPYMFESNMIVAGTLKDNSYIGEYVTYAGRNYRVVETSEEGTKLILDGYYDANNDGIIEESDKMQYNSSTTQEGSTLANKINEDNFINWLTNNNNVDKSKLATVKWYRGGNWTAGNYKTNLESKGNSYDGQVGLIRVGEVLSGQSETILSKNHTVTNSERNAQNYWTATPNTLAKAWKMATHSHTTMFDKTNLNAVRPVIVLAPNVQIASGNGTFNNPYTLREKPLTISEYLTGNKVSGDITTPSLNGLYKIGDNGELTNSDNPREYRYVGAKPDNYIKFNDELWRIIGIFDGKLKIMRNDYFNNSLWDTKGTNDWTTSSIGALLNSGDYYNRTGSYSTTGLTETSKSMIESVTWNLGGVDGNTQNINTEGFYESERGTTVYSGRPTEWQGQVGLMYPSDYGLATNGGNTLDRSACLNLNLYNWKTAGNEDCKGNSWITQNVIQWTMTPNSKDPGRAYFVYGDGHVYHFATSMGYTIRPVVYLKADVNYMSGNGTSIKPFIIG